jgi:predicted nuclease of restriction endonuclease-like (RecB) superfamily
MVGHATLCSRKLKINCMREKTISNFDHVLSSPQSDLAQMTLRSPYLFDFLSLGKDAHEREIGNALGDGFAFLGRQYHIQIAEQDYWIDLLYPVRLKSYIIIWEFKFLSFSCQ